MSQLRSVSGKFACAILVAGAVLGTTIPMQAATAPKPTETPEGRAVYFDGRHVELTFTASRKHREFSMGPWVFANRIVHEKPRDTDPNLYLVVRGTLYSSPQAPQYDHNEIISLMPVKPDPIEWDVYWALVLDPTLTDDFRSEKQLLLSAQQGFEPGAGLDFDAIPSAAILREFLHVTSIEGLERFRRPDGTLPRIAIVQAGFSMKGAVVDPEADAPEGRASTAISSSAADDQ